MNSMSLVSCIGSSCAVLGTVWVGTLAATATPAYASGCLAAATVPSLASETVQIDALRCVLAVVATALDEREKEADEAQAELDRNRRIRIDQRDIKKVQAELTVLGLGQLRDGVRVIADLDRFLIRSHVKYKDLKKDNEDDPRINDIDESIHDLLERRGRLKTMSAVLRGGFVFADAASNTDIETNERRSSMGAAGKWPDSLSVLWGTKHWNDEEWNVDFSLSGQVATGPVVGLFSAATDADEVRNDGAGGNSAARPDLLALHQPGLLYEAHANTNFHLGHEAEMTLFFGGGQTRLLDRDANIGMEDQPTTVTPIANGVGLSAYRYEVGLEYKLYGQDMDIVHHEKSLLSPVFSAGFGYRVDERYTAWPGLCHCSGDPRKRWFWSLDLDLLGVIDQRLGENEKGRTFGIRLSAGRERGGIVPSVSRVLLEFDVNLAQVIVGL